MTELLETEVKFHLPFPETIRSRIQEADAQFAGRSFEKNIRFEDDACSLMKKKALLRLRKTESRIELTYKGEPPEKNMDFKVHRELEVTVSDFDTTASILKELGFHEEQIYEKYRETWNLDETVVCMDNMPFGDFLEIEGSPENIRKTAASLGLDWEKRILENYLSIFQTLKNERRLSFNNVTFENFKKVDLDFSELLHLFEADGTAGKNTG